MNGLTILGTGHALPKKIVTNDDLARRVDTNDEWIVTRTGIRERRVAEGETLTELLTDAARMALAKAGLTPADMGLCITATITPDCATPSEACLLHEALGLPEDCPAFDLGAGCSGFLYALETAAALLPRLHRPYALVLGGEELSRITDWDDRSTCILFGDGAGAAVVRTEDVPWFTLLGARGDGKMLYAPGAGTGNPQYLHMDGQGVFQFAIKTIPVMARELAEKAGLSLTDIDWFVPHQANHRIVESAAKRLGVSLDRFYENMEHYGNTSAASIPIALSEMAENGLLKDGQWIMCLGFGSGLTWGGALFQWKENA